jgi:PIN domain nuclease of toxin-antitoxin system
LRVAALRVLLDTDALLWWLADDEALTRQARKTVADTRNSLIVSAASAWEIATEVRLGRLPTANDLAADFSGHLERDGFELMAISAEHAIRAGLLPGPHKDPFDRMASGEFGKGGLAARQLSSLHQSPMAFSHLARQVSLRGNDSDNTAAIRAEGVRDLSTRCLDRSQRRLKSYERQSIWHRIFDT